MFLEQVASLFPYNLIGLAFLIIAFSFLVNRNIEREKKIVRYVNIIRSFNDDNYNHGEAASIRHELGMTHEKIVLKAPKIIARNKKLLLNNPAQ